MINTNRKQQSISRTMILMGGLLSIFLFISLPAKADVTVTVKVNVTEAACSVTGEHGDQAKIEFGDVSLDRVKSADVKKQTTLHITCEGDAPGGKTLNLTLKEPTGGTMSYDGNQVLGTNVSHLGIGLTLGNSNTFQPLNAAIPVSAGDIELGGVLVTDKADELQAGSFSAAVSVVAAYM